MYTHFKSGMGIDSDFDEMTLSMIKFSSKRGIVKVM